ncbi:MAG: hypothetical protein HY047_16250 [Acidobacteria bacterium]|nr:hypothetical protein [Acidobacteriota bacterium]
MPRRAVKLVSAEHIRKLFSDAKYEERAHAGEFTIAVKRSKHPAAPLTFEPICTKSQTLAYVDRRKRAVAIVHRYLRPDGTVGASGRPDPKYLVYDRVVYQVDPAVPGIRKPRR